MVPIPPAPVWDGAGHERGPVEESVQPATRIFLAAHIKSTVNYLVDFFPALFTQRAKGELEEDLLLRLAHALQPAIEVLSQARSLDSLQRCAVTSAQAIATFPALAETVQLMTGDWLRAKRVLFRRLIRDKDLLHGFGLSRGMRIERVTAGLSEPHDGCHTVTALTFRNNRRVVYKPRAAGGELLWSRLLRLLRFTYPAIVPRRSYHWMEFVAPAEGERSRPEFYFHWGAQIALARIIQAADLHRENWVAARSGPVLVDLEAIGPEAWNMRRKNKRALRLNALERMLLFGASESCSPVYALQGAAGHFSDLADGIEYLSTFVLSNPVRRATVRKLLERELERGRSRVIVRSTAEYLHLLARSLHPTRLLGRASRHDFLVQACSRDAPSPAIARREADLLLRCSIPRFTTREIPPRVRKVRLPGSKELARCVAHLSYHRG